MVNTETKIQCYEACDGLSDVDVARDVVLVFGQVVALVGSVGFQHLPSVAAKMLIIKANSCVVAGEHLEILESRDAADEVVMLVEIVAGILVGGVSVVDVVVSPIVKCADCAVGFAVSIRNRDTCKSASDFGFGVE